MITGSNDNERRINALLGATAVLSGYSRLSYSLTVMMMETT
jgi:H+/Cl- antiporter ClcA